MSTYRYVTTSILSGRTLATDIPLVVSAASRVIGGIGRLDGYLPLDQANPAATTGYLNALIPDQAMLWMLQDGYPIWCGPVVDSPHQSIDSHQYPITAYTPESILQNRLITGALNYTGDVFDTARALVTYATAPARGPNAQIAGLYLDALESGISAPWSFGVSNTLTAGGFTYTGTYADNQPTLDALTQLSSGSGFEYTFEPRLQGGVLQIWLRLGYPALGRYNSPAITVSYPGPVIDYARPVMRSQSANYLIGTSTANGTGQVLVSQYPHGVDGDDLDQGYILRQLAVAMPGAGASTQAQVNQFVDSLNPRYTAGTMVPTIVLGGGSQPSLTRLGLGDALKFAATSDLDLPVGAGQQPGLQITARMTGWSLQPPASQQPEKLTATLGALVGVTSLGKVGVPS